MPLLSADMESKQIKNENMSLFIQKASSPHIISQLIFHSTNFLKKNQDGITKNIRETATCHTLLTLLHFVCLFCFVFCLFFIFAERERELGIPA